MKISRAKFDYSKPFVAGLKSVKLWGKHFKQGDEIPEEFIKELGERRCRILWNQRKIAHLDEPVRREKVVAAGNKHLKEPQEVPVEKPVEPTVVKEEPPKPAPKPTPKKAPAKKPAAKKPAADPKPWEMAKGE